jgi:pilus assembly protein TadC
MDIKKNRWLFYFFSIPAIGIMYFFVVVFLRPPLDYIFPRVTYGINVNEGFNEILILLMIAALIPIAYAEDMMHKRNKDIDSDLPFFLSSFKDGIISGLDFINSWEAAARGKSPVRLAAQKVLKKIYLGVDFISALNIFAEELGTKNAYRISRIIAAAYLSGGRPGETLDIASKAYLELERFHRERLSRLKPYLYISYISLLIFLISAYILIGVFYPTTFRLSELGLAAPPSPEIYKGALFYASIIISFSSSLISSKLASGSVRPGLKHVIIMLIMIYIVFFYII